MRALLSRSLLALAPLLLALLFGWLTVEGRLNLGAGEKDIVLVLPVLAWALLFACACAVNWWRGAATTRGATWAAIVATALLLVPFLLYWLYFIATRLWYVLTT